MEAENDDYFNNAVSIQNIINSKREKNINILKL